MPAIMTMTAGGREAPRVLIDTEMRRPTALTIDFNMDGRLLWADELKYVIESCKPDGTDRTVMFTQTEGSLRIALT